MTPTETADLLIKMAVQYSELAPEHLYLPPGRKLKPLDRHHIDGRRERAFVDFFFPGLPKKTQDMLFDLIIARRVRDWAREAKESEPRQNRPGADAANFDGIKKEELREHAATIQRVMSGLGEVHRIIIEKLFLPKSSEIE